jgi:hypothetical protein
MSKFKDKVALYSDETEEEEIICKCFMCNNWIHESDIYETDICYICSDCSKNDNLELLIEEKVLNEL